jgi:AcrR family transcriptional regulator
MTIRQVARSVGVDPGTIRHYFPSKDDLVHAAAGADIELSEVYDQIAAELSDQSGEGVGDALIAAALRYLCEEESALAAVAVCLTGGDYESTVFGLFDRDVVTPLARDLASGDSQERSALVMSAFLGFQLLATLLPALQHTLRDEDVQAILAESIERHLRAG